MANSDAPKGELIVIAHVEAKVRATRDGAPAAEAANVGRLSGIFAPPNVNLVPLFGRPEDRFRPSAPSLASRAGAHDKLAPNLSLFYRVDAPPEQLSDIADQVRRNEAFEAAYIKPFTELPQFNDQAPAMEDPPSATPDFSASQGYLDPAPGGVDARYAWTVRGGDGTGVGIIDIEGAWRFSHEALSQLGGVVGGVQQTGLDWRNHGTAVLGIMGGAGNGFGVSGICPGATIRAISHSGTGQTTATAIRQAADLLSPGDIILLEAHRPGPQSPTPFNSNDPQLGYIAIEWWPDDYAAIVYAVRKGIIVVGAAGNGAVSLDDPIYDQNPSAFGSFGPFPSWWRNPFRRNELDSGAILVGAGAPPSGAFGPDRSRLTFSNYGLAVDAQGWGRGVVSTGYGDLQGPRFFEDIWYTSSFSGTSSASPIVVGTLACLQGAIKSTGGQPLPPLQARQLLRGTGSEQEERPGQAATELIGKRPDLRQLLPAIGIGPNPVPAGRGPQQDTLGQQPSEVETRQEKPGDAANKDVLVDAAGSSTGPRQAATTASVVDRLAKLEAKLDQLAQFIGVKL
jgi:hypothetical protein